MTNPFLPPGEMITDKGVFGDDATLVKRAFLFRVIEFRGPITGCLVYSGWWFRQKIEFNGHLLWFKVSWLNLCSRVEFTVPRLLGHADSGESYLGPVAQTGADQDIEGLLEIHFARGLRIRRFRIWFDGTIAYDEIA